MSASTVFYAFNGSQRSALSLRPNDVLQWQALRDAAADGYARYDLGEVAEGNNGLKHLKRKWGAQPIRLHRYSFRASEDMSVEGTGTENRRRTTRALALALALRAWRRVPPPATALAGRFVFRYL